MTILVFGKTGQVATELQARAGSAHEDMAFLGRDQADLSDPATCAAAIEAHAPSAVINAAAYTAVDKAEEEEALATVVNGEAPGAMAQACAALDIPFLHVSTDYVFEGSGETPWRETDPISPQNAYGRSKAAGEKAVLAAGGNAAILRTSWVFSAHGANFVKTMLRLSESRNELNIVDDQIGVLRGIDFRRTPGADDSRVQLARLDPTSREVHVLARDPQARGPRIERIRRARGDEAHGVEAGVQQLDEREVVFRDPVGSGEAEVTRSVREHPSDALRLQDLRLRVVEPEERAIVTHAGTKLDPRVGEETNDFGLDAPLRYSEAQARRCSSHDEIRSGPDPETRRRSLHTKAQRAGPRGPARWCSFGESSRLRAHDTIVRPWGG